jgi:putative transposase
MPRANRYIQPGCLYHLTHRCHDRKFLLRFAVVRSEYRKRLHATLRDFRLSLLAYAVTSNHTHLLAEAPTPTASSQMMQKLEGEFAEWYNLRQSRSGAFWGDRYHCTLVDGGSHAWNCMKYIDLNTVRTGVVGIQKNGHGVAGTNWPVCARDTDCST